MIEVRNLGYSYGRGRVLDGVSFTGDSGKLIAVLGANGAGKSTMFRCILRLLKDYEGEIRIGGEDIRRMTRRELARRAAYIPQAETPVFNYTVADTVLMGAAGVLTPLSTPGPEEVRTAEKVQELLGIRHLADRGIGEISGGERQLAYLARAMAQRTKLLIMDEPTANLDYGNQQMVLRHVKNLAENGYTVLMSTHSPEQALQYADQVLVLKDHRVFAFGDTEDVLDAAMIREIYGLDVVIADVPVNGRNVKCCVPATAGDSGRRAENKSEVLRSGHGRKQGL